MRIERARAGRELAQSVMGTIFLVRTIVVRPLPGVGVILHIHVSLKL